MNRIAFITTAEMSAPPTSDVLTARALESRGHQVESVRWDGGDPVGGYDLLVFRSCWNYHLQADAFMSWLKRLDGLPVVNPLETIWWNIDKRYLLQMARSVPVVPTRLLDDPTPEAVWQACSERGWDRAIVKPTIGATAYRNTRLASAEDFAALSQADLPNPTLLQPYIESVEREGEFSLIFFDGRFSHAVRKRAAPGEYRVQEEFGGTPEPFDPDTDLRTVAERAMTALPATPVYARVDLVLGPAGPLVMEVELIEPELYVAQAPESAHRFADAIVNRLG